MHLVLVLMCSSGHEARRILIICLFVCARAAGKILWPILIGVVFIYFLSRWGLVIDEHKKLGLTGLWGFSRLIHCVMFVCVCFVLIFCIKL